MDAARKIVLMTVIMVIESDAVSRSWAKECNIFRMGAYCFGRARAADMAIQAEYPVGRAHNHMEVVADYKDAADAWFTQLFY